MNFFQLFDLIQKIGLSQFFKINALNRDTVTYVRNYMATHCICVLLNLGFFDQLRKDMSIDGAEFARHNNLDKSKFIAVLEYLFILKILNKVNGRYILDKKGRQILDCSVGSFDFAYAYAPLFENLEALLRGKKRYKVDIFRRGGFVAKATAEVSQYIPIPIIKKIIDEYGFKKVLDLGCGSADFLLQLSQGTDLDCYGIDISKDAIELAQKKIRECDMVDRVHVRVGDIFNLKHLAEHVQGVRVMTCMFVLHEFIHEGEQKVVDLLIQLKQFFPKQYLIVCEFSRFCSKDLRRRAVSIAEHHLFHALSEQGVLTPEECRCIFQKAGYKIIKEIRYDFSGQVYFLLN